MLHTGDPPPEEAPDWADRPARTRGADGAARVGGERERLAAFDEALAEIAACVEPASRQAGGWLEQTRAGLIELLRFCDERPETARELVVESIAWGPGVLERRGQLLDALAEALDRARAKDDSLEVSSGSGSAHAVPAAATIVPSSAPSPTASAGGDTSPSAPPPGTAENLVGACVSLVHTRLLREEPGLLVELAPSLMSVIAHPYLGAEAARHELQRPLAYAGARPAGRESEGPVASARESSY
ncbi:MAG TPA: hypothetical protein VHY18_11265 [Solirubrobacteraceae bacterium]|jgi:hypothetical protein|nr:hypothetical protein [Solirubrobacteraceae bacterium]